MFVPAGDCVTPEAPVSSIPLSSFLDQAEPLHSSALQATFFMTQEWLEGVEPNNPLTEEVTASEVVRAWRDSNDILPDYPQLASMFGESHFKETMYTYLQALHV